MAIFKTALILEWFELMYKLFNSMTFWSTYYKRSFLFLENNNLQMYSVRLDVLMQTW